MDSLNLDILVSIVELARPQDIPNLRLVDKRFNSAVGLAGVELYPREDLTSAGSWLRWAEPFPAPPP